MTIAQFDPSFYLEQNPDVRAALETGSFLPIEGGSTADQLRAHFDLFGANEGRAPNAVFDEGFYRDGNPDVANAIEAGFFESGFAHFQQFGINEARLPSAAFQDFDEQGYLEANPDVANAVVNGVFTSGLQHFLRHGAEEGRTGSDVVLGAVEPVGAAAANVTVDVRLVDDPAFAGLRQDIIDTTEQAVGRWLDVLDLSGLDNDITLTIDVSARAPEGSAALAYGGSSFLHFADELPQDGVPSTFANKLTTGEDNNGDAADAFMELPQDEALLSRLTFGSVGERDTGALDVFTHEIGHALGILSFEDSVWGQFVEDNGGELVFTGPNAMIANGGEPVLLEDRGHLSDDLFPNAIMSSTASRGGGGKITDVEIGILRDIGLPVDDGFGFIV